MKDQTAEGAGRLSSEDFEWIRDSFKDQCDELGDFSEFWGRSVAQLIADHDALREDNQRLRSELAEIKDSWRLAAEITDADALTLPEEVEQGG